MNGIYAKWYDKVAKSYDDDVGNIRTNTTKIAIQQCIKHLPKTMEEATDLSAGTGYVMETIKKVINIDRIHINDVSEGMLNIARQRLPENTHFIQDDALNIHKHVTANSQDLVCGHYFLSFCPIEEVLARAYHILKPGGFLSLMTCTKQNLKSAYEDKPKIVKNLIKIDSYIKNSGTPHDHQTCRALLSNQGFLFIDDTHFTDPLILENVNEAMCWAIDTGWLASYFHQYFYLKKFSIKAVIHLWNAVFGIFPLSSNSDISIIMAKKPE